MAYYSTMLGMHFADEKLGKGAEQKAILDQQKKYNELLQEQNNLLNKNISNQYTQNTEYKYLTPEDIEEIDKDKYKEEFSILQLLAILSIIPIVLGFIMTFLSAGSGTEEGVKILIAGCICPILYGIKNIFTKNKN